MGGSAVWLVWKYVDANSGKFALNLTSERIQVNAGTKV